MNWLYLLGLLVIYMTNQSMADDLSSLSDEFNDATTYSNWLWHHIVEQWPSPMQTADIDTTVPGRLYLRPWTTTWYADYRGPHIYKQVTGDFIATTSLVSHGVAGSNAIPTRAYSLGGVFIRAPRVFPKYEYGHENYVFLSIGTGDQPGVSFQCEDKSTVDSASNLVLTTVGYNAAELRIARIGNAIILLRRNLAGGAWVVHRRFSRPDLPATMNVGATSYTDWDSIYNTALYRNNYTAFNILPGLQPPAGNPDLVVEMDFYRFCRPIVPPALAGLDLSNEGAVPDAWLTFLTTNTSCNFAVTGSGGDQSSSAAGSFSHRCATGKLAITFAALVTYSLLQLLVTQMPLFLSTH